MRQRRAIPGLALVLVLTLGLLSLTGCANFEGEGNEFDIEATIASAGPDSVLLEPTGIKVNYAAGEAKGFFHESGFWSFANHLEVHNNYNANLKRKRVGKAYDDNGQGISTKSVPAGRRAHIVGKIRSSSSGKSTIYRAVFDELEVLEA